MEDAQRARHCAGEGLMNNRHHLCQPYSLVRDTDINDRENGNCTIDGKYLSGGCITGAKGGQRRLPGDVTGFDLRNGKQLF